MRAYKVVDAFSAVPFKGNPVAVVLDGAGLGDAEMQVIARWTNLSETTFLLPASQDGADYHLRIFTPRSELPFAGHPTLGSAHAALEAGIVTSKDGVLVQQCGQGLVKISVDGEGDRRQLTLELPAASITPLSDEDVEELEAIVGQPIAREVTPAVIDVGAVWVVAQLADADSLLAAEPDFARSARFERRLGATGLSLFGNYASGSDREIEVRSFAPSCGVDEDPVCGSGNGSVAVFRAVRGLLPKEGTHYVAAQGQKVGRDGRIKIGVDSAGRVTVGGACVTSVDGVLHTAIDGLSSWRALRR